MRSQLRPIHPLVFVSDCPSVAQVSHGTVELRIWSRQFLFTALNLRLDCLTRPLESQSFDFVQSQFHDYLSLPFLKNFSHIGSLLSRRFLRFEQPRQFFQILQALKLQAKEFSALKREGLIFLWHSFAL